jgi:Icc-related predicted phosphoesterase
MELGPVALRDMPTEQPYYKMVGEEKAGALRILCISDTHLKHHLLKLPEADILIHSGDFSTHVVKGAIGVAVHEIVAFDKWIREQVLPLVKYVVVIAGNHDLSLDAKHPLVSADIRRVARESLQTNERYIYLEHEAITLMGVKIFGSPFTPAFGGWGFGGSEAELKASWEQIPADTQVLITHGPPRDILDRGVAGPCGCPMLTRKVATLPCLQLHVFGHVHEAGGAASNGRSNGSFDSAR